MNTINSGRGIIDKRRGWIGALCGLFIAAICPMVSAQLIVDFSGYTTGVLEGQAGGTGLTANWTGTNGANVVAGDLSGPAASASLILAQSTPAQKYQVVPATSNFANSQSRISFASPFTNVTWLSFVADVTGAYRVGLSLNPSGSSLNDSDAAIFLSHNNGNQQVEIRDFNVLEGSASVGSLTNFFIVARMDPTATTDNLYVWLNPTSQNALDGAPQITGSIVFASSQLSSFALIGYNSASELDNVRFGTSLSDVTTIPEPGILSLVGAGLTVLLMMRRRGFHTMGIRPSKSALLICALLGATCLTASAAVVVDFSGYATGALEGQAGGAGLTGNWTGPTGAQIVAGDLSGPAGSASLILAQSTPAQKIRVVPAASSFNVAHSRISFASPSTGVTWLSFVAEVTGSYRLGLALNPSGDTLNDSDAAIFLSHNNGNPRVEIRDFNVVDGSSAVGSLTNFFIVARMNPTAITDNLHVWINPTSHSAFSGSPQITGHINFVGNQLSSFALIGYNSASELDNVRFGTELGDVITTPIPEPGTLSFLALGVMYMFLARRFVFRA